MCHTPAFRSRSTSGTSSRLIAEANMETLSLSVELVPSVAAIVSKTFVKMTITSLPQKYHNFNNRGSLSCVLVLTSLYVSSANVAQQESERGGGKSITVHSTVHRLCDVRASTVYFQQKRYQETIDH